MKPDAFRRGFEAVAGDLVASPNGDLPDAAARDLFSILAAEPERLGVAALTTASLVLIHPQALPSARGAVAAVLDSGARILAGSREALPMAPLEALAATRQTKAFEQRQAEAAMAAGWGVSVAVAPRFDEWQSLLRAFRASHLGHIKDQEELQDGWMNWLDDVIAVPNDRRTIDALYALRRTFDGSLDPVPNNFALEVVCDEGYPGFVLTLTRGVAGLEERELGRFACDFQPSVLRVRIDDPGEGLRDPLRIEHVVRHLTLRQFLCRTYDGRFTRIEYTIEPTGETWARDEI